MIICKFCGFENPDGSLVCSRCETSLTGMQASASYNEPMIHECGYPLLPGTQVCPNCHKPVKMSAPAVPAAPAEPVNDPKKTMRMPAGQVSQNQESSALANDPKKTMRAPVGQSPASQEAYKQTRRDVEVHNHNIPVTNEKLTVKDVLRVQNGDSPAAPADKRTVVVSRNAPRTEEPVSKQTINPFAMSAKPQSQPEPETFYCALKPASRTNEPDSVLIKREYEEPQVVLNRDNLEPGNMSITSREQAVLTCENGVWYIEDHSSLQTTFVLASRKMPLQDGDIILMGDREFVFTTKHE